MLNQQHESKSNYCLILSRVKLMCDAFHRDAFLCTGFKYFEEKHSLVLQREKRSIIKMCNTGTHLKGSGSDIKSGCFIEELKSEVNINLQKQVKVSCSFLWAECMVPNVEMFLGRLWKKPNRNPYFHSPTVSQRSKRGG